LSIHEYHTKGEEDTRPERYKVQVFTHSGCMIELEKAYKCIQEAMAEASTISVNGLQGIMTNECMTFIPVLQISSVSIEDTMKGFVPNLSVTNLTPNAIAVQPQAQLESQHGTAKPQSN